MVAWQGMFLNDSSTESGVALFRSLDLFYFNRPLTVKAVCHPNCTGTSSVPRRVMKCAGPVFVLRSLPERPWPTVMLGGTGLQTR